MRRRGLLKLFVAAPLGLASLEASGQTPIAGRKAVLVRSGQDRSGQRLLVGGMPLDNKVSGADSNGGLYVFEHRNMGKGGPFRHFHQDQDEWVRVVEGDFVFEVGSESFRLTAGDSIFAPRRVPHVWAHVGERPDLMNHAQWPFRLQLLFRTSASPHNHSARFSLLE